MEIEKMLTAEIVNGGLDVEVWPIINDNLMEQERWKETVADLMEKMDAGS